VDAKPMTAAPPGRLDVNKTRLLACLFAIALGASAALAYPADDAGCEGRRRPAPCLREEAGTRQFNWHALVEAMLPPALRAHLDHAERTSSEAGALDSGSLAEELAALARVARRAAGSLS
jgi:hypothetical protein